MAKLKMQKTAQSSKFLQMMNQVQEETGPKCVACEDGYTAKPNEILGVYVFQKRMDIREISHIGGVSSVTHNNYIHFLCHQSAAKVDRDKQQSVREWDGAKVRNHMTLCNNLFPVKGGSIGNDAFQNTVDRYFNQTQSNTGCSDMNRVKILVHDLKKLLKKFALQESFSRDSQGGGPESNMHLIPMLMQVICHQLVHCPGSMNLTEDGYVMEFKLREWLGEGDHIM